MSCSSLVLRGLLASPLFIALAHASPLAPRQAVEEKPSFADIEPIIVEHGPLDDEGIKDLLSSLSVEAPSPTQPPTVNARQGGALALTTGVSGPFQAVDAGKACGTDVPDPVTVDGPFQTLHFFTGSSNLRGVRLTAINGEKTTLDSPVDIGDDKGEFVLGFDERITEFTVFPTDVQLMGFKLKTNKDRTYEAMSTLGSEGIEGVNVPVGSGILGRLRVSQCDVGIIAGMGFDFIDDIESVSVVNIDYSGFTDNVLPSGPGQTVTLGSQIIDNRNGSIEQSTTLATTAATNKQHSLTTNFGWDFGNSVTISGKAGIPFISEGSVSTTANWGISGGTNDQSLEGETITNAGTVNLKCPARKFCVGSSFFTMFKLDVDIVATLEAKSKSGGKFTWTQSGKYEGSDSLALQLRIDEADAPSE
ncbi:hypothetical protein F5X68DRAFT_239265 [Plectosphaerella plurivora]|uniref:Uncharacterized protein n=1 Tax=Plectosphaerella plurivora TaxID=936078 RepID=A0A9P8VC30_9PEZI|nr:hypothetical protein F5X68DRAFT_239265 [Plectosphaerella plurivora]